MAVLDVKPKMNEATVATLRRGLIFTIMILKLISFLGFFVGGEGGVGATFSVIFEPCCEKRRFNCYGRPLLQAWLLPELNTIPNNCIGENSL